MLPGTEIIMAALVLASQFTGMPIPPERFPVIESLSDKAMRKVECPGCNWVAYTNWDNQKIYLRSSWQPDLEGQCVLAHELTHWLQIQNNATQGELERIEPEAYFVTQVCYQRGGDAPKAKWAAHRVSWCSEHQC